MRRTSYGAAVRKASVTFAGDPKVVAARQAREEAAAEGLTLLRTTFTDSGFQGVTGSPKEGFEAALWRQGRKLVIGRYGTAEEAALAHARALHSLFEKHAERRRAAATLLEPERRRERAARRAPRAGRGGKAVRHDGAPSAWRIVDAANVASGGWAPLRRQLAREERASVDIAARSLQRWFRARAAARRAAAPQEEVQLRAAVTIQAGTRRVLARLRKRRLNVLKRLQADDLELRADYHATVVQAAWRQHVLRRRGVSAATRRQAMYADRLPRVEDAALPELAAALYAAAAPPSPRPLACAPLSARRRSARRLEDRESLRHYFDLFAETEAATHRELCDLLDRIVPRRAALRSQAESAAIKGFVSAVCQAANTEALAWPPLLRALEKIAGRGRVGVLRVEHDAIRQHARYRAIEEEKRRKNRIRADARAANVGVATDGLANRFREESDAAFRGASRNSIHAADRAQAVRTDVAKVLKGLKPTVTTFTADGSAEEDSFSTKKTRRRRSSMRSSAAERRERSSPA